MAMNAYCASFNSIKLIISREMEFFEYKCNEISKLVLKNVNTIQI